MYVLIHHDSQGFELVSLLLVPRETFVSCDLHGLYGYFKKSSYRMMRMMRMKSRVLRSKTDGFADVFEFEWDKRAIAIDNMEPTVGVS